MVEEDLPERTCIVTREVRDEADLIRFGRSPDGLVVPDIGRKLPGRGVWVTAHRGVVAEAARRKLFSRGFKAETAVPDDLAGQVSQLLRSRALGTMSLARKAGEAVTGFMKVEEALTRGRVNILVHAADAAADGCQKLTRLAGPSVTVTNLFSGTELDLAFGRSNVVHAALTKGGLAEKLLVQLARLAQYEAPSGV
jgi:predicted RNA-binding protein YlxR (DUF448 family)